MEPVVVIVIVIALAFGSAILYSIVCESSPPPPPPSPEDYDQQAAINRAAARALDAEAAYHDSRAKAALKRHELQEVEQFINEQQGKREK